MSTIRSPLDAARKHLEVLETWGADHQAAMQCRDFEDWLAEAMMVFRFVSQQVLRRRRRVFHALEAADPQRDMAEKELFQRWLDVIEGEWQRLETLEKTYGGVEGAERLRSSRDKAKGFLAAWAPAVPSMAVADRALEWTEEEADELESILHNPTRGRPKWEAQSAARGDASLLR